MSELDTKLDEAINESLSRAHASTTSEDYVRYTDTTCKLMEKKVNKKHKVLDFIGKFVLAVTPVVIVELIHNKNLKDQTERVLKYEKDGIIASTPGKGLGNIFKLK